jgi:site-specific DNA-methyltransferase (adenine-specific)
MDKLIGSGIKVDAIIGDLPYGTTACSWDEIIPFAPMWERVKKINKGVFVTTASQPFTSRIVCSNLDDFKYEWIWNKEMVTGFLDANKRPMKQHENILIFCGDSGIYIPQKIKGIKNHSKGNGYSTENSCYGSYDIAKGIDKHGDLKFPKTIINIQKIHPSISIHPTQKPVALYEYLIRTYTNEGDTVLDFTCGSGTTGVACVNTNRNCILIDNDQHWIDVATKRVKDAQQQMRLPI